MVQKKSKTTIKDETVSPDATAAVEQHHPVARRKKTAAASAETPAGEQTQAAVSAEGKEAPKKKTTRKATTRKKTTAATVKEVAAPAAPKVRKTKKKETEATPIATESAEKSAPVVEHKHEVKATPAAPAQIPAPYKAPEKHATPPHAPAKKIEEPHHAAHPPVHAPHPKPATAPAAAPAPVHPAPQPQAPQPQQAAPAPAPVKPAAAPAPTPAPITIKGEIRINEQTTLRDLADKMNVKVADLIKKLLTMGSLATINQRLDTDTATLLSHEFGYIAKMVSLYAEESLVEEKDDPAKLKQRPPVVTIMGHVDHGKTSLLDAIRETRVVDGEAGGITQHIGAYKVKSQKGDIAFLDTPGHEAFTAMRSRGTKVTDIVVLVVSATDGVMPQTVEAIDHARAAGVPIIVAINKIDVPTANPAQTKQELTKYNLVPEDWGGDTIMVEVSAMKKINIDLLLEMILLKAEMMELKANPDREARGVVIEAKLDPKRGPVATVLVENGTLRVGDTFIVGTTSGKIRAMIDEHNQRLSEAPPSTPVEILGITTTPQAGEQFIVVADERQARDIATGRQNRARQEALRPRHHLTLEDISSGKVKQSRLILKADVQGSLGALRDSLERLSTPEINLNIIHAGVGAITESDVTLAAASDALIIGFNIRPDTAIDKMADHEGVSIRIYRIIYEVIADVRAAMEGLLEPQLKEVLTGKAVVRQVFKVTKGGTIAGCMVTDGKIQRGSKVRLVRDNVIVYQGNIASLRRFKDDVKEVEKGFECGISLENYSDLKPGDLLEVFIQEKVARTLEESRQEA